MVLMCERMYGHVHRAKAVLVFTHSLRYAELARVASGFRTGPRRRSRRELTALWLSMKTSGHTRRAYAADAARFLVFIQKPLAWVTLADLQAWRSREARLPACEPAFWQFRKFGSFSLNSVDYAQQLAKAYPQS